MTAKISAHERATRPSTEKRRLCGSGVRALTRRIALCLSWQTTGPTFARGLGDDFTAEVAQALTVAHRSEWDGSMTRGRRAVGL